jgi:hypothetical protein
VNVGLNRIKALRCAKLGLWVDGDEIDVSKKVYQFSGLKPTRAPALARYSGPPAYIKSLSLHNAVEDATPPSFAPYER